MRTRACAVATAGVLLLASCGSETADVARESESPSARPGTSSVTAMGSCVEQYSLDTLKDRDYAFDGVVDEIRQSAGDTAEDVVVFDVSRWYKGSNEGKTTRRAYGFAAVTSAGGKPHAVGERLLVAGDEDFVWECGFTQPYDAEVAAKWERALS